MNKRLRLKFVAISTLSVGIMILSVVVVLNLFNYYAMGVFGKNVTHAIDQNKGEIPVLEDGQRPREAGIDLPKETLNSARYFVVYFDENGNIINTNLEHTTYVNSENVESYVESSKNFQDEEGYVDRYYYKKTEINGNRAIIFADVSKEKEIFITSLQNSFWAACFALLLSLFISYILSPYAIKPIIEAYDKQKIFITNAAHEIKTPLTVISANLDIIEMTQGDSKWTVTAKEQVQKLVGLVNDLVSLSRMEEVNDVEKEEFSVTEMITQAVNNYQTLAMKQEKTFKDNIDEGVVYNGNKKNINQLIDILLDNAFKYCKDEGRIEMALKKEQTKLIITVKNTVDQIEVGNHPEFFNRFYRQDKVKTSKKSGFGIGLSLAKSIVSAHRGEIIAKSEDGSSVIMEVIL